MDAKNVELTLNWWKKFKPVKDKTPKIDSELTKLEVASDQLDFETARSAMRHIEKEWKPRYDKLKKSKVKPEKEAAKRIQAALEAKHQWLRDRMEEAEDDSESESESEEDSSDESDAKDEIEDDGKDFIWRRDVSKDLKAKNLGLELLGIPEGWTIALEIPDIAINSKGKPRVLLSAMMTESLMVAYKAYFKTFCSQIVKIDGMAVGDAKFEDEEGRKKIVALARSNADKLSDKLTDDLGKVYHKVLAEYLADKSVYEKYKRRFKIKIALASIGITIAGVAAGVTAATGFGAVIAIPLIAAARALAGMISDIKDQKTQVAKVEGEVIDSVNSLAKSLTNLKAEVAEAKEAAKKEGLSEEDIWEAQKEVLKGVEGAKDEVVTRKGQRIKSAAAITIRTVTGQRHAIVKTSLKLNEELDLWSKKISEAQITAEHMAREVLKLSDGVEKASAGLSDIESDKKKRKALEFVKKQRQTIHDLLEEIAAMNKALKVSKTKRAELSKVVEKLNDLGPKGVAKADAIAGLMADITLMVTGAGYSSFDPSQAINCISYLGTAADDAAIIDDVLDMD